MKWREFIVMILLAGLLCGCAQDKSSETIQAFNEREVTFETLPQGPALPETQLVRGSDRFLSVDGNAEYTFKIDQTVTSRELSVVEVVPRVANGENARRMAEILMPEAEFYGYIPYGDQLSKAELRENIDFYSQFANPNALKELYGRDNPWALDMVSSSLDRWMKELETAPEREECPCDWVLRLNRFYFDVKTEAWDRPVWEDAYTFFAMTKLHDVEMLLDVVQVKRDGKLHSGIGFSRNCAQGQFEDLVLRSRMFRTEEPTDERIEELKTMAEDCLNQLELGQWKVTQTRVEKQQMGDATEYNVLLDAVPVVNGQITMRSGRDTFGSKASFQLSERGEVYYFALGDSYEETEVHQNIAILPMEEILEKAREHLGAQTMRGTGKETLRRNLEKENNERILCKIEVPQLEFRLMPMQTPFATNRHYYVPVVGFLGTTEYVGVDSAEQYSVDEELRPILWINALNGNVVIPE